MDQEGRKDRFPSGKPRSRAIYEHILSELYSDAITVVSTIATAHAVHNAAESTSVHDRSQSTASRMHSGAKRVLSAAAKSAAHTVHASQSGPVHDHTQSSTSGMHAGCKRVLSATAHAILPGPHGILPGKDPNI